MSPDHRPALLDLFARSVAPLSATEAARACGLDLISGAGVVAGLAEAGLLVAVSKRLPMRFELASRGTARVLPAPQVRPVPGTCTTFGLICGVAA